MHIEFEKEYLREIYEEGNAKNKKYRIQPQLVKQYKKTVDILKAAADTEVLYKLHSLHYEKKHGTLEGIEAVYLNKQYRLLFRTRKEGEEPNIVTICALQDISKHYQ
jgi:toxin HigB-1